jgi:glutamate synthase domain-containing protein 2
MIHFLDCLRELSGGKPTGIRVCISDKKEFYEICYAIRKSQVIPDFIVVEDRFQVTSIASADWALKNGMPLYEALLFVSQTLQVHSLEKDIKLIAAGKFISGFDILKVLALGANVVFTEMTDRTNVKYHINGQRTSSLYKKQNAHDFHKSLMSATIKTMKACGIMSVSDITLTKFLRRLDVFHSRVFEKQDGPISYPGLVNKEYTSNIKSRSLEQRKGVQYGTP